MIEMLNGSSFFEGGVPRGLFLIHSKYKDLYSLKYVVIMGTGHYALMCSLFLERKGVKTIGYADNNESLRGTYINSLLIESPYYWIRKGEHIVICVKHSWINEVRCQLEKNMYYNYSVIADLIYYKDNNNLYLNELFIRCARKIMDASRMKPNEYLDNKSPFGMVESGLCGSAYWHHICNWLLRDLIDEDNILEIGSGAGMLSLILRETNSNCRIDWLHHGTQEIKYKNWDENKLFSMVSLNGRKGEIFYGYLEGDYYIEKRYSKIVMTEVMEHFVCNPVNTLQKIRGALTENGRLYLSTPDWGHVNIYQSWRDMPTYDKAYDIVHESAYKDEHIYQYNYSELEEIFQDSGLCIIEYSKSIHNNHNFILKANI